MNPTSYVVARPDDLAAVAWEVHFQGIPLISNLHTVAEQYREDGQPVEDLVRRSEVDALISSLVAENERLKIVVSQSAEATGAFISPKASIDFMEKLPGEIRLNRESAERLLAEARATALDDTAASQWLRQWVKGKFGVWITWRTAWAAIKDMRALASIGGGNG